MMGIDKPKNSEEASATGAKTPPANASDEK
jgi:hypothetical protein